MKSPLNNQVKHTLFSFERREKILENKKSSRKTEGKLKYKISLNPDLTSCHTAQFTSKSKRPQHVTFWISCFGYYFHFINFGL